uniref:EGF-like domain-containing protein n=1 Tax=Schistocephalus solidus TaxID=70667 RepID=A0A0X3NUK1_SCHSO
MLLVILIFTIFLKSLHTSEVKCTLCRSLMMKIREHFDNTAAHNFGGGNTDWEERFLGSYFVSETRLNEILEKVYSEEKSPMSNGLLSDVEEFIEDWWLNNLKTGRSTIADLEEAVCVHSANFCCPWNKFGVTCAVCSKCSSFGGFCDGNGTRTGSGKCICRNGYIGEDCQSCNTSTHFAVLESDGLQCLPCHPSCLKGCTDASASTCVDCKAGWKATQSNVSKSGKHCADIDECSDSSHNCQLGTYCVNIEGSFNCKSCAPSCATCHGPTSLDCLTCASGYQLANSECIDINECSAESTVCRGEHEKCVNTPGSYRCDCEDGYTLNSGKCVKPAPTKKAQTPPTRKANAGRREKPKNRIIWTVSYTFEFLKFFGILCLFGLFFYFFSKHVIICLSVSVAAVAYVCYQSSILDSVFMAQK